MRPMNPSTLIEVLRTYNAALRENGATGLYIYLAPGLQARSDPTAILTCLSTTTQK
jgi:hypothetical protein